MHKNRAVGDGFTVCSMGLIHEVSGIHFCVNQLKNTFLHKLVHGHKWARIIVYMVYE